ncbi:hypothetical protein [Corynebacterium provencense]|uniref:hypothetical protein n=1 Tax=Corynebacterium provencense TaxID=1737425 RepID=UPI0011CB66B5|nr:hypothetical protein [Corynebacterium provencense]
MRMLPMDRACLQEIATTGTTTRPWLARDLTDTGLIVPACHDRPPHVCTSTACPDYWRWTLTTTGRNHLPGAQMEIPL